MHHHYLLLKTAHMSFVALSFFGFVLRFYWVSSGSALSHHRLTKILPHMVDTGILVLGLTLMAALQLSPIEHPWLGLKLLCLCVYILLGTLALKRAPTVAWRWLSFAAALLVFAQMVGMAVYKNPLGWVS